MSGPVSERRRLLVLDAARGVAALSVMMFHVSDAKLFAHGYLAVDLFFLLSGFVVADAYSDKLARGASLSWFFGVRMARLYPLYAAGMIVAFMQYLHISPFAGGLALGAGLIGLPFAMPGSLWAYPLNNVHWSLIMDVAVSMLFAAGGWRLGVRGIMAAAVASGALLGALLIGRPDGNVGWQNDLISLLTGFVRAAFGFSLGALIHHLHHKGALKNVRAPAALGFLGFFAIVLTPRQDIAFDLACIGLGLPLVFIALVCAAEPAAKLAPICNWSGRLSYPLYSVHMPFIGIALGLSERWGGAYWVYAISLSVLTAIALHYSVEPIGKRMITRAFQRYLPGDARAERYSGLSPG